METIRSASNRALRRIREVAAGRDAQAILLEGDRLVDEALRSGLDLELVCVAADRGERAAALEADGHPVSRVLPELLDRAGTLVRSAGVVASRWVFVANPSRSAAKRSSPGVVPWNVVPRMPAASASLTMSPDSSATALVRAFGLCPDRSAGLL